MSKIKAHARGNLGRDPEKTANGPVKFSVACNNSYKDASGQKVERVEWLNVTVWGKLGDVCLAHLKKGRLVHVEGEMRSSEYEKDGQKHRGWELVADTVEFLGGSKEAQEDAGASESDPVPAPGPKASDDDIPF